MRGGLRSIDSLEFRKHESFTMGIIHHFVVPALAEETLLLDLHGFLLVLVAQLGVLAAQHLIVAFLQRKGLVLEGKGVDHLRVRYGSASVKKYRRCGTAGTQKVSEKVCIINGDYNLKKSRRLFLGGF